ncbi:NAD+ kinase [Grosmannia clavigera kw1407]|uniref:NAD+ kinase n=1 Tax=Grosmannia clavigera (strain kw1407 / UAMH 11150) TaxID=655863 RepID=F0XHE2_GROCL|nr:NAD+ kinase [Grosmannia clavigera kw1407]EFX02607.1 NAD+ kinase [Grosmannia clavigera kw1407]
MAGLSSPSTAVHPALAVVGELPCLPDPVPLLAPVDSNCLTDRPRTSYNTVSSSSSSDSLSASRRQQQGHEHLSTAEQTKKPAPPRDADRLGQPRALPRPQSARAQLGTLDTIPRQTIMKALASVARSHKPEALSLSGVLSASVQASSSPPDAPKTDPTDTEAALWGDDAAPTAVPPSHILSPPPQQQQQQQQSATSSSQLLCDALNDLALRNGSNTLGSPATPAAAALSALQSPCYYHQRFDDAVDIDKVLEEIKNDEYMSHSRLVQTATGVREVSKQLQRRPIRRAVRNVMIVTKARDNELVLLTRELAQWLMATPRYGSEVGVNVYVDAKLRNSKRFGAAGLMAADLRGRFATMLRYWTPDLCWTQPENFDLVITLGGDGTVLFTSWLFQRIVPPVLSFSLGSLGFLTTFEYERFREHLDRIMGSEGMRVNLRMRFTCTVYRNGKTNGDGSSPDQLLEEGEQFEVLNELVIDRGPSPYVSNLELYGDDELLTVVQADGCIFSTPTGSTAYSLSAGGSLVHPDIPAILLTPICPHTLSFRPMVLSDTMLLRVSIPRNSRATAYCAFDGKGRVELRQGDCVTITASQYPFPTVTRTDTEWFDSVSRTLRWNTRAATQKGFDAGSGNAVATAGAAEKEEPDWDIDTDSGYYASEEGSTSASPLRRQMSLLGM